MPSRNRFRAFSSNWLDASFLEDDIGAASVWENPHHVASRDIDWESFLSGPPLPPDLKASIAIELHQIDPPLMVVLPLMLKSILEHLRRLHSGPDFHDIVQQLDRLGTAAASLAAVAQGGTKRDAPTSEPDWWRYTRDDVYGKHIALGQREEEGRSPFLHPALQDHLVMAMAPTDYALVQPDDPKKDAKLRETRQSLTCFFEHLHALLPVIKDTGTMTRQLAKKYAAPTQAGSPPDQAKNWVLVRLMWIWRDVLREEPRIYLRKIEDDRELERPEPQGCMAFVVAVLDHVEPIGHWNYPALERQLLDLRASIPSSPLLRKALPS